MFPQGGEGPKDPVTREAVPSGTWTQIWNTWTLRGKHPELVRFWDVAIHLDSDGTKYNISWGIQWERCLERPHPVV